MPSFQHRSCVFECSSGAEDSIEHYCQCRVLDESVSKFYKKNPIAPLRPVDDFFGTVKGMDEDARILRARLCHVKLRLMHLARLFGASMDMRWLAEVEWSKS